MAFNIFRTHQAPKYILENNWVNHSRICIFCLSVSISFRKVRGGKEWPSHSHITLRLCDSAAGTLCIFLSKALGNFMIFHFLRFITLLHVGNPSWVSAAVSTWLPWKRMVATKYQLENSHIPHGLQSSLGKDEEEENDGWHPIQASKEPWRK